jgi:exodeoxyribonuclease VII small subunit
MSETREVSELSFEEGLGELEGIVRKLEEGRLSLEESLTLFERGQALAAHCNAQLDQAELRISQLTPEGEAPFDPAQ